MPGLRRWGLITAGLLQAGCSKPFWKAPPPEAEPVFPAVLMNAEIDSILLIQTPCMAPCPTYWYMLRSDGTASYEGQKATPILGLYLARLDTASFDTLVAMLRRKHFLQLARRYEYLATDQSSKITRVFLADTVKEVERYGEPSTAPRALYEVEAAIEDLGARLPWQYVGPSSAE